MGPLLLFFTSCSFALALPSSVHLLPLQSPSMWGHRSGSAGTVWSDLAYLQLLRLYNKLVFNLVCSRWRATWVPLSVEYSVLFARVWKSFRCRMVLISLQIIWNKEVIHSKLDCEPIPPATQSWCHGSPIRKKWLPLEPQSPSLLHSDMLPCSR